MTSDHHSQVKARRIFPGIAIEGLPFIAGSLALTGLLGAAFNYRAALLPLALTSFVSYFFRDPERAVADEAQYLYAPADGRVMFVEEVQETRFIKGPAIRIAIFLSIFNVHINRSPVTGLVRYREHVPGKFRAAWQPEIEPGNECQYLGLETPRGPVLITQVAGLLARRIVCRPQLDEEVHCGERIGLIKFSSRTDLIFPRTMARPLVTPDTPVRGAITPIGAYL